MNYKKIYDNFIENRRYKKRDKNTYMEVHHIIPRCLGGNNDKTNLIRLTSEDHVFAHLLLAKIHGGRLWSPIFYIIGNRRKKRVPTKREIRIHAYAKAKQSIENRGSNNPSADNNIYNFEHIDGTTIICNKWHMITNYKLKLGNINMLISDNVKSTDGWFISGKYTAQEVGNKKGEENNKYNHTKYTWRNYDTQEIVISTIYDMHKKYGGCRSTWTSVVNNPTSKPTAFGWHIEGRDINVRSGKGRKFNFINRDGRFFNGTQNEFIAKYGLSAASGTRITKYQSVSRCGWRLNGTVDRHFNSPKNGKKRVKGSIYTFSKDGNIITGDRNAIAKEFNTTPASVNSVVYAINNNKIYSFKGWILENVS